MLNSDLTNKSNFGVIPTGTNFNDLNTIQTPLGGGLYSVEPNCTNGVTGDAHFAIIIYGGYRTVQIGITYTQHVYIRVGTQGTGVTWTQWKEFSIAS